MGHGDQNQMQKDCGGMEHVITLRSVCVWLWWDQEGIILRHKFTFLLARNYFFKEQT